MIYLIILIYIIYLNIPSCNDNNRKSAYWFLYLLFVFIAGFRYNLGNDTYAYTQEFKNFPTLFELDIKYIRESNYQLLWIIFESLVRTITNSFYLLQITLAAFVNFSVFRFIKSNSKKPFFSILLYYLLFYLNLNMEILRESVCISLLLLAFPLIGRKQYFKFYVIASIAFLFHNSGIILFIIPLFIGLKLNKRKYIIIIVSLLVLSGFISVFFSNIIQNITTLYTFSQFGYFDSLGSVGTTFNTQILLFIKYVALPTIILFFFYHYIDDIERKLIFLYIASSILYLQIFIFYRVRDYFLIFLIISFTNGLITRFSNQIHHQVIKGFALVIFLYITLFRVYYSSTNYDGMQLYLHYYPYNSILNEDIPQSRLRNFAKVGSIRN